MRHGSDWYKRDPHAFLGGVQGLSAREHAVYSVTLDLIYQHAGSINNDPGWIAGWISDMGAAAVRNTLKALIAAGKLELDGDQITQKHAKNRAKTKEELSKNRAENGKKGGKKSAFLRAEAKKTRGEDQASASTEPQPEEIREEERGGGGARACAPAPAREEPPSSQPDQATEAEVQTPRERLLAAMGADPVSGIAGPNGKRIGTQPDMEAARRWQEDLGLTIDEQIGVIEDVLHSKRDGPPSSFRYFNKGMERLAGAKNQGKLRPDESSRRPSHDKPTFYDKHREFTERAAAGQVDVRPYQSDPFSN